MAWAVALAVGLLGAALRLWAIDLAPFGYDEVDVLGRARAVAGGELTATGPLTSWGIPDPPLSVYLMVLPSFAPSPAVAAAAWSATLNVVAVMLTYFVALRFFGGGVALAAGILYAVNPWAVYFSRRTWAELVPLLTVIALWAALEVVCRRRAVWAVPFFVALAMQLQTRVLALVYAPAAVFTFILFPRRWGVRWPIVGIFLAIVASLPYAVYVLSHWSELSARLAEGNRGIALAAAPTAARSAPELLAWTAAGYGLLPAISRSAPWLNSLGQVSAMVMAGSAVLIVAGLSLAGWSAIRRRAGWEAGLIVALWAVLPLGMLMAQSSTVYLHYLVALFPALFLLMGLPLGALLSSGRLGLTIVGGVALVALVAPQIGTTVSLYRVLSAYDPADFDSTPVELRQAAAAIPREASDHLGTGERYGVEVPIRFWSSLADRVRAEAARTGTREVAVIAGGTDPLIAERPAILDYLLRPDLEPRFLPSDTLVFPAREPVVVLEAPDVDPAENLERFGERRAAVPVPSTNRFGRDDARITSIPARSADNWAGLAGTRLPATLHGGVELLAYRAPRIVRPGDDLVVLTYWRLRGDAAPRPPNVTVRLLDEGGRVTFESEPRAPIAPPAVAGDRVMVTRHVVPIPARATGDYRLEAMATSETGVPLRRADDSSDGVTLTPVRVAPR